MLVTSLKCEALSYKIIILLLYIMHSYFLLYISEVKSMKNSTHLEQVNFILKMHRLCSFHKYEISQFYEILTLLCPANQCTFLFQTLGNLAEGSSCVNTVDLSRTFPKLLTARVTLSELRCYLVVLSDLNKSCYFSDARYWQP